MTGAWDLTTAHQLLGRIVYFHALFIEPALTRRASATPGTLCCNHDGFSPGQKPASVVLQGTAWAALDDVSVTLPAFYQRCPAVADNCCAVCRVAAASAAIATCWADTEYRAYHQSDESARVRACGQAAAVRIGAAFATLRSAACPTLNRLTITPAGETRLPTVDELPLTGELLTLWDRAAGTGQPVVSWLNHCADLRDIRRYLDQERTEP